MGETVWTMNSVELFKDFNAGTESKMEITVYKMHLQFWNKHSSVQGGIPFLQNMNVHSSEEYYLALCLTSHVAPCRKDCYAHEHVVKYLNHNSLLT